MQLERYTRQQFFEPVPEHTTTPQLAAPAPARPTRSIVSTSTWSNVSDAINSMADSVGSVGRVFSEINKNKKQAEANNYLVDMEQNLAEEVQQASISFEGDDYKDKVNEIVDRWQTKMYEDLDEEQANAIFPVFRSRASQIIGEGAARAEKHFIEEKKNAIQRVLNKAVENGDRKSAHVGITNGIEGGLFTLGDLVDNSELEQEAEEFFREKFEGGYYTKEYADQYEDRQESQQFSRVYRETDPDGEILTHWIPNEDMPPDLPARDPMSNKEILLEWLQKVGNDERLGSKALLRTIDQEVKVGKIKKAINNSEDMRELNSIEEGIYAGTGTVGELDAEKQQELADHVKNRKAIRQNMENEEKKRLNEYYLKSLYDRLSDGTLSTENVDEASPYLSDPERRMWHGIAVDKLAAESDDGSEESRLDLKLRADDANYEITSMIESGVEPSEVNQLIDWYRDAFKGNEDALREFDAQSLKKQNASYLDYYGPGHMEAIDKMVESGDLTKAAADGIKGRVREEVGRMVEENRSSSEISTAIPNIITKEVDNRGKKVNKILSALDIAGIFGSTADYTEVYGNEYKFKELIDNAGAGFLSNSGSDREKSKRFISAINSGAAIGLEDNAEDELSFYKRESARYFSAATGNSRYQRKEIAGGLVLYKLPTMGTAQAQKTAVRLNGGQQPTKEEVDNLKNGGWWVMDVGENNDKRFITQEQLMEKYDPYSGLNTQMGTGSARRISVVKDQLNSGEIMVGGEWKEWNELKQRGNGFHITEDFAAKNSIVYYNGRPVDSSLAIGKAVVREGDRYHIIKPVPSYENITSPESTQSLQQLYRLNRSGGGGEESPQEETTTTPRSRGMTR